MGASSGIGAAIARHLAEYGASAALLARSAERPLSSARVTLMPSRRDIRV
jgi:NADP-dependent 3-hydroxy acid dehydrogenase YdfG